MAGSPADNLLFMDQIIAGSAIIGFLIFFILQLSTSRLIDPRSVMKWIFSLYMLSFPSLGFVQFYFERKLLPSLFRLTWTDQVILFIFSFFLFSTIVWVYVLAIYGTIDSALRVRLLSDIAGRGTKGISEGELLKTYNCRIIIQKRLDRMIKGDILKVIKGKYTVARFFPPLIIQSLVLHGLGALYHRSK